MKSKKRVRPLPKTATKRQTKEYKAHLKQLYGLRKALIATNCTIENLSIKMDELINKLK